MSNITEDFNEALAALNDKDLKRAEELFKRVIKIDESNVPALNLLVVVLMSTERFSEAEPFIERATSLNQKSDVSFYNYGLISKRLNKTRQALENFGKALGLNPNVAQTWNNRGTVFNDLEKYDLAIADFDKAISLNGAYGEAYANKGKSLACLKRYDEAFAAYDRALSIKPDLAEAWLGRGNIFSDLKRYDDAFAAYDKALSIKPDLEGAWLGRGNVLCGLMRYDDAFAAYDKALSIKPDSEGTWLGRGNVLCDLKRYDEAFAAYDKALSIKSDSEGAWLGRGNVFFGLKRYDEALAAYDKALSIKPNSEGAWLGRGNVFFDLKCFDEAFAAYDRALSIKPDLEGAWLGRGNVFFNLKCFDEALAAYDRALSIKPDLEGAWLGRGNVFFNLKRFDEALAAYDRALSVKPDLEGAWLGRGNAFFNLKRFDEALAAYDKALSIKSDSEGVEGQRLHAKMSLCNWENLDAEIERLIASVRAGRANSAPFAFLSLIDSPDDHLRCAQAWVVAKHPQAPNSFWQGSIYTHDKIRIGYVSADFRRHAIASLTTELFECHNRNKFTITAFSHGLDDKSGMRQRLVNSFDNFVDCRHLSDADVARTITNAEIDILVDLNGFTRDARTNIFSHRPAPIQVNYLGYPGTMGTPYIDYIIGDKSLFTLADATAYSEKLVQLPHSYQPNDRKRHFSNKHFEREECSLPEDKFVFCCFNNNYKIAPSVFDSWMRILKRIDGSVLWLLSENQAAIDNLRKETRSRGIDPARLVFANRMELPEHLARHRVADLFLDTLPYNAHTTASDALWAGVPVLTRIGNTFAGRVASSLLNAIGLPELITHSREEYETIAIDLALNGGKLKSIKEKLSRNRLTAPLFDTPLYTMHLEAAYEAMYQRHNKGLPPDHIEIDS